MIVETIHDICGLYFRSILVETAGERVEQHAHDHDHATLCGSGSAQYWENDIHVGDVKAGGAVLVRAGQKHAFVTLEDNTRLTCVHDIASAEGQRRI